MTANTVYWTVTKGYVLEFTKDFYDLGLVQKYVLLSQLPETVLNNIITHERIVQAILQHSPAATKKMYPCKRERKLSKIARERDEEFEKELASIE